MSSKWRLWDPWITVAVCVILGIGLTLCAPQVATNNLAIEKFGEGVRFDLLLGYEQDYLRRKAWLLVWPWLLGMWVGIAAAISCHRLIETVKYGPLQCVRIAWSRSVIRLSYRFGLHSYVTPAEAKAQRQVKENRRMLKHLSHRLEVWCDATLPNAAFMREAIEREIVQTQAAIDQLEARLSDLAAARRQSALSKVSNDPVLQRANRVQEDSAEVASDLQALLDARPMIYGEREEGVQRVGPG